MRKTIVAILSAAAIALGVTASAGPAQASNSGSVPPPSPEYVACMEAARIAPVAPLIGEFEGTPIYAYKIPGDWYAQATHQCWLDELARTPDVS